MNDKTLDRADLLVGRTYTTAAAAKTAATKLARTHCKRGHPLSGDNLRTYIFGGRSHRQCRTCKGVSERKNNKSGNIGAGVIRRVFEAAHEGKTITEIDGFSKHKYIGGRIVKQKKLRFWMRQNPSLGRRLQKLFDANRAQIIRAPRRLIAAPALVRNDGMDAYEAVRLACRDLPEMIRDDVMADMILAIAEGQLKPRDAARRACEFVTAHNRMYSKYVPGGGLMYSLDAPISSEDGSAARINFIREDQRMWGA